MMITFKKFLQKTPYQFVPLRSFSQTLPRNIMQFDDFHSVKNYMDTEKPIFAVLFFTAKWNPQCAEATKHFEELGSRHIEYSFIKVDSDKAPVAKKYYGVKYEPEFIITLLGGEMFRHYGLNQQKLEEKLNKVTEYYNNHDIPNTIRKHQKFNEFFMCEYNDIDAQFDYFNR